MSAPSPPPGSDGPDWVRDSVRVAADELRRFVGTVLGFTLRPARFSADWLAGGADALNPLAFVATALAVSSAAAALVPGAADDGAGLGALLVHAAVPYVYYAALGALFHPVMRLFGSTRPLRASVAVGLFAGGGPGLILYLTSLGCKAARTFFFGASDGSLIRGVPLGVAIAFLVLISAASLLLLVTLARGERSVHGAGTARALVALAFAVGVTAVALGALHRRAHVSLGVPHFVIVWYGRTPVLDLWF